MESIDVEYKSDLNEKNWNKWLKTLVAFSNTKGGDMYVFYDDQGKFIGIDNNKQADVIKTYLNQMIRAHTSPIINYSIEDIYNNDSSRVAFKVSVKCRSNVVTWLTFGQNDNPRVYIRDEGDSIYPNPDELQEMILRSNSFEFDTTITGIKGGLDDFSALDEEYQKTNDGRLTMKLLRSFNLIDENENLTVAGLVFVDESGYKNANMVCNVWPTVNKGGDSYVDSKNYNGSAISLIYKAIDYIKHVQYYSFGGSKKEMHLEENGSFSISSLREALVNAFAHRDYRIDGGEISIDCFPDRIEISSPGAMLQKGFETGIRKLESIVSQRRNHAICDTFVACHLMEKKGSGFDKIIEEYKGLGDDYFPLMATSRSTFTIILKNKKTSANSNRNVKTLSSLLLTRQQYIEKNPSTETFFNIIKENPECTYPSLSASTGLTKEGVKYNIKKLKDGGFLAKASKRSAYILLDDSLRPCSIYQLDVEIRERLINWISNNCDAFITDASVTYERFKQMSGFSVSLPQFVGAILLAGYSSLNEENTSFKK